MTTTGHSPVSPGRGVVAVAAVALVAIVVAGMLAGGLVLGVERL